MRKNFYFRLRPVLSQFLINGISADKIEQNEGDEGDPEDDWNNIKNPSNNV